MFQEDPLPTSLRDQHLIVSKLKVSVVVQVCCGKRAMTAVKTDSPRVCVSTSAVSLLGEFRINNRVLLVVPVGSERCQTGLVGNILTFGTCRDF